MKTISDETSETQYMPETINSIMLKKKSVEAKIIVKKYYIITTIIIITVKK